MVVDHCSCHYTKLYKNSFSQQLIVPKTIHINHTGTNSYIVMCLLIF